VYPTDTWKRGDMRQRPGTPVPVPSLAAVIREPTPDGLWSLRSELLEAGLPADAGSLRITAELREFLDRFATATSARDLNHLASKLDMGAIGGVVLEQLFERPDAQDLAMRVLTGGLSEGLMVLASRQYVHAQELELAALFRDAAWTLFDRLWVWTAAANPDLEAHDRRRLIEGLTGPLRDHAIPHAVKAALAARIFLVLLAAQLRDDLDSLPD
jgi:hypothetical protein